MIHRLRAKLRRVALYITSFVMLVIVRVLLYVTKFAKIKDWFVSPTPTKSTNEIRARLVARSISKTARFIPKASCMTQALACQAILSWLGEASEIILGAAKADPENGINTAEFHAWVLWDGKIILGGEVLETRKFTPLSGFPSYSK